MTDTLNESLGEAIVYEDDLPLAWDPLPGEPAADQLARWNAANERILRLVSGLEEHHHEMGEDHSAEAQELARLDFKLNLVLELVGELLATQLAFPPPRRVRLNAQGIQWHESGQAPTPNGLVHMTLYLHRQLPKPLELVGRVQQVDSAPEGGRTVVAAFHGLSEPVHDLLEKLIFRHHRRSIAARPRRG